MRRLAPVLALLLTLVVASPAAAGTYDVTTCSLDGPGGVNNAWTETAVKLLNGQPPEAQHIEGFAFAGNCATSGLYLRSGTLRAVATWGTWKDLEFVAPPSTRITRLVLSRDSRTQLTASGGRWAVRARQGDGAELGGPGGPDQCKPSEGYFPSPCTTGTAGYGQDAVIRYDLATDRLIFGLECGGTFASCDTGGSGAPQGYVRLKASVVTVRDDTAPALDAAGSLLESGWRRGDADVAFSAADNTGIRDVRLLIDGQERSRVDLACDYTFTRPCADAPNRRLGLGSAPLADGERQLQLIATDASGNPTTVARTVSIDAHGPQTTLTRASGKTITVRVSDAASGLAGGTIEVRNRPSDPFRALPTTLANGRLTARLDRGSASRVGIRVTATDNVGNVTSGHLNEMSLRVGGRSLRGGAASVGYGRSASISGRLLTRDGQPIAGQPMAIESTPRVAGAGPRIVATVTTSSRGGFTYRAPAGVSRTLRFLFNGAADLVPLTRTAQLRVRASSTISASPRVLRGRGRVRFAGRLGLRGATTPRSGKIVELQAYDGGRWRTFATARARSSKGRWSSSYTFAGTPGRYPVRLRIRREAVFPYDLGYSRSVVVRVR